MYLRTSRLTLFSQCLLLRDSVGKYPPSLNVNEFLGKFLRLLLYVVATSFPGFSPTRPYGARARERDGWEREPGKEVDAVERFHSLDQSLCKFISTKESANKKRV